MESTIGGTRRHLVDLCGGLCERGADVHVVAATLREPAFARDLDALAARGCTVHPLQMVRAVRPLVDARHERALRAILRSTRPAIVHTHSSKAGALGRSASSATGIGRRVHTPHTFAFLFDAMFSPAKRRLFRWVETRLARRTDRLVAVSESEATTIRASGVAPPGIVRVVPNGIDPAPWLRAADETDRAALRAALGVPAGAPLAAVVGLLNAAKGQDLALRALAEVPGAHMLVVGDGAMRPELARLARAPAVAGRAHVLGWRDDVPALLAASDLLVLPSRWEGMPYVALEAMAAGLPVVATRVDGAIDAVVEGETGHVVDVESPAALAEGMRRVLALDGAARRAMGAAGRARCLALFTRDAMVARMLEVYGELLGGVA